MAQRLRPHGAGAKLLAVLCCALVSCTTLRTHVSTIAPEVLLRDGHATLQLDLWVESNRKLTPEEEAKYRDQARQAVALALSGRTQAPGSGALVVRTVGVTRTEGHRGDQVGAAVGIAVGIVVIVAVVIIAIASGEKGGGSHHASVPSSGGRSAPRLPAPRVGSAPRVVPPGPPPRFAPAPPPRVAPIPGVPGRGFRGGPVPRSPGYPAYYPHGGVSVGVEWWIPLYVEPAPPPMVPPAALPPPDVEAAPAPRPPSEDETAQAQEPGASAAAPAPEPKAVPLAPPDPIDVSQRGFWDGDRLVLDAVLVDPATGEVIWRKKVARSVDPRDAKAVRAAVDELLSDKGWEAQAPSAPPGS